MVSTRAAYPSRVRTSRLSYAAGAWRAIVEKFAHVASRQSAGLLPLGASAAQPGMSPQRLSSRPNEPSLSIGSHRRSISSVPSHLLLLLWLVVVLVVVVLLVLVLVLLLLSLLLSLLLLLLLLFFPKDASRWVL